VLSTLAGVFIDFLIRELNEAICSEMNWENIVESTGVQTV